MPKGDTWTSEKEQTIINNRGKLSIEELGLLIGKTPQAIKNHWLVMKKEGRATGSLRHWKSSFAWCEECSARRTKLPCPVCNQKKLLQEKRNIESELYARLTPESKGRKRPSTHGSYLAKRPKPPDVRGMDAYSSARVKEIYDLTMQRWEIENTKREIKTIQKRIERYRKEL